MYPGGGCTGCTDHLHLVTQGTGVTNHIFIGIQGKVGTGCSDQAVSSGEGGGHIGYKSSLFYCIQGGGTLVTKDHHLVVSMRDGDGATDHHHSVVSAIKSTSNRQGNI